MLFDSFPFAAFYAVVLFGYFGTPHRFRWAILLAASYFFYAWWSIPYLGVIAGITLVDYFAAIRIEQAWGHRRRLWLGASVAANLGLLFVFKYLDFFNSALHTGFPALHLLLPVGISFHTFQAIGYTVDVYRGRIPAERHLGLYALFVAFFPQMVAGPIERGGHLLPQFRQPMRFDYERLVSGLQLALRGLVKKVVVADLAAPVVNLVYSRPREFPGPMLLLATVLFSVQIYCDFSGYSDMAVGLARVLGFNLTLNFNHPWRADSIAEFWRRWHVSLSSWFRDYVYIPLGGSRFGARRRAVNVVVVFLLSGLWHGANWTFVCWGALHGVYMLLGHRLRGVFATNALVTFAWIFFRAATLQDATYIATHLLRPEGFRIDLLWAAGLPRFEMMLLLLAVPCLYALEKLCVRGTALVCAAGVYTVVFFGVFQYVDFIYFRF